MGKKKQKKLQRKLDKLSKKLYDENKLVSREEFIVAKLSKRLKEYYNSISPEQQEKFIEYIIKHQQWEEEMALRKFEDDEPIKDDKIDARKCKNFAEVARKIDKELKKQKEREKRKNKHLIKTKSGMYVILNPEAYDHTLLDDKKYRKYLKKVAEKEKEQIPVELDCTLSGFIDQLVDNRKVNKAVTESFWNKHGY